MLSSTHIAAVLFPILFLALPAAGSVPCVRHTGEPAHPVRISANGRYFVDQTGVPVFWLGTTQWSLFRNYTREDAKVIFKRTRALGFTFAHVMLLGVGDPVSPNVYGEKPWLNDNPLTPNEAYFSNVDAMIQLARENNIAIVVTLYHQRYGHFITVQNARGWAKWVGARYKDVPTIVWSTTPVASPDFLPVLRELAVGLREGDGGCHLMTAKPDPAPFSSSFAHSEKWLDFNSIQTWNRMDLIYPFVTKDYNLSPTKPVLMAEGAYEAGSEYGFAVTPLWIRRQAYYSYLAGGHHTYGHNDSWRVLPTWKQALDAPGAAQLGILRKVFTERPEWWHLIPDQSIFVSGGLTNGNVLRLAARHREGHWAIAYLGAKSTFSIRTGAIRGGNNVRALWIDPRNGRSMVAGHYPNRSVEVFLTPAAWEDALLILEPWPN